MARLLKLQLIDEGIRQVLNSEPVQDALRKEAEQIAQKAGGEYSVTVQRGKTRAHARVSTKDNAGYYRELRTNRLLTASSAGVEDE